MKAAHPWAAADPKLVGHDVAVGIAPKPGELYHRIEAVGSGAVDPIHRHARFRKLVVDGRTWIARNGQQRQESEGPKASRAKRVEQFQGGAHRAV